MNYYDNDDDDDDDIQDDDHDDANNKSRTLSIQIDMHLNKSFTLDVFCFGFRF